MTLKMDNPPSLDVFMSQNILRMVRVLQQVLRGTETNPVTVSTSFSPNWSFKSTQTNLAGPQDVCYSTEFDSLLRIHV